MTGDRLTLEYDQDDRAAWLIVTSASGIQRKSAIWLREGFGVDDVRAALLATGWVKADGSHFRLTSDIRCEVMRDVLDQMLGYFKTPDVPGSELLEIQSAVAEYEAAQELIADISLYAYAWLDVMLREDLADEARSANDIWTKSEVNIQSDRYCDRRVEELISRYSRPPVNVVGRMAGSMPTRQAEDVREVETG